MKPCPFCGGNARLLTKGDRKCFVCVKCVVCGAMTAGTFMGTSESELYERLEENGLSLQDTIGGQKEIERWELRKDDK